MNKTLQFWERACIRKQTSDLETYLKMK